MNTIATKYSKHTMVFYSIICMIYVHCFLQLTNTLNAAPVRKKHRIIKKNVRHPRQTHQKQKQSFSTTFTKFFDHNSSAPAQELLWETPSTQPFTELILSWNALRPATGSFTFWISVKYGKNDWSGWQRMSEWGAQTQRSFVNKKNPYVHTKHVRVEMQKRTMGRGFKIKVTTSNGAKTNQIKALFACLSNLHLFSINKGPSTLPTTIIQGVPKQSQMVLKHPRYKDLCSPTSTSILVNYFKSKLETQAIMQPLRDYTVSFANKVHDRGRLDIYGNWQLNVAQAFDAAQGDIFFRVERLNGFHDLHGLLLKKIPVAVSVRRLRGGALPYENGHFIVVVGWNQEKQELLCIDPAFTRTTKTLRWYKLRHFLAAWGRSVNLSYIPIPSPNSTVIV